MAKGQNQQNQQGGALSIKFTTAEVKDNNVKLVVQASRGNKPAQIEFNLKIGDVAFGNLYFTDSLGISDVIYVPIYNFQPGKNLVFALDPKNIDNKGITTVIIPTVSSSTKESAKNIAVKPLLVGNKLQVLISGPKDQDFFVSFGGKDFEAKTSSTGTFVLPKNLTEKAGLELNESKDFFVLSPGYEYELYVSSLGGLTQVSETFIGKEDISVEHNTSVNLGVVFIFGIWLAILGLGMYLPISIAVMVQTILFVVFCIFATKTAANNYMFYGMIILSILTVGITVHFPGGESFSSYLNRELYENIDWLRISSFRPEETGGGGSWLFLVMSLVIPIETIIFIPFAFWDEAKRAYNRGMEIWKQRTKYIYFSLPSKKSESTSEEKDSPKKKNILQKLFGSFEWEAMDEAIIAAAFTEGLQYFMGSVFRRRN